MAMPEAAMNENHLAPATKYEVWATRKALIVKPIAIAHAMNETAHQHLGLGVLAPNTAHPFGTGFGCESVDH